MQRVSARDLRFADHTASRLWAVPVKSPLLCSYTVARAPLSVRRHMRARSSCTHQAVTERPLAHHSSLARAPHQGIVKTGERKRDMRLAFYPLLHHNVWSIRETLSAIHLGSTTQIAPLLRPASPRPIREGSTTQVGQARLNEAHFG
jgi:hypothetical protein